MRNIIALGTIGILLLATTSCDIEGEPPIFEPQTKVLQVYKTDTYGYLLFALRGTGPNRGDYSGYFYAPVNLPEEYKRHGLQVNVTFRQRAGARGNYPVVEILEIEERTITSRFFVLPSHDDDVGSLILKDDLGNPGFFGAARWAVINLPEEYSREGLNLYITYRSFLRREGVVTVNLPFVLDVIEVRSIVYSSRFYVHKLGDCGYFLVEDLGDPEPRMLYPVNLSEEYQQEGLNVNVTYRILWLDEMRCEGQFVESIEVISIMETPEARAETRITGGEQINITGAPWQVLITRYVSGNPNTTCAGSIIEFRYILTARHCLHIPGAMGSNPPLMDPANMRVHFGITCRSQIAPGNTRAVSHFEFPDSDVDAAILVLSDGIRETAQSRPINIWGASTSSLYNIGAPVRVAGWGQIANPGPVAECLQAVNLNIVSPELTHRPTLPHEIVAHGIGPNGVRRGACNEDSGGALTALYACGTPVHIGIVSHGDARCERPSIFVRTSYLMPWLERFRPRPTTPPAISGPNILCVGSEFTIRTEPGVPVTWRHSHGLQRTETSIRTGVGIFRATRVSAQADWVEAVVNGVPSRRHELWVGTPFIERIQHTGTGFGTTTSFRAMISMISPQIQWGLISRFTWEIVDTPHWEASFIGDTNSPEVTVQFHIGGPYMITVRATNACGQSMAAWINVLVFGENILLRESATTDRYSPSRPISGSLLVLLSDEESGRRRHTYDVRIYDSWGNRVKQVIAEDGSAGFDLSDLPDGTYYLHICNGVDEPMIQPIVVENRN